MAKLERLKAQLQEVKDLFRNEDTTEFVIVTIPTVSASAERPPARGKQGGYISAGSWSTRSSTSRARVRGAQGTLAVKEAALREALEKVMEDTAAEAARVCVGRDAFGEPSVVHDAQTAVSFCTVKAKDQRRAMEMLDADAGLRTLKRFEAPLFDMEIRGVPALQFMGGQVWTD